MTKKCINVGLIGCGVVGTGVANNLVNGIAQKRHLPCELRLKRIADLYPHKERPYKIPLDLFTTNADEILDDPEIDIVVELIGGCDFALKVITKALEKKKHVVTANKALLAEYGREMAALAKANGVDLYYEAAVCGGIPVIKAIREGLTADSINNFRGIVNGTCNYILTGMCKYNMLFEDAVKAAQMNGYAEADPTFDLIGKDSLHKLVLLIANCFGQWIKPEDIYTEGIMDLDQTDIRCAEELGYVIKLIAQAKKRDGKLECMVAPTLISKKSLLAGVSDAYNAVEINGSPIGRTVYYGEGAGMNATSSAVTADIIDIARNIYYGCEGRLPVFALEGEKCEKVPTDEMEMRYYLRWKTDDKPGVISALSQELTEREIGISSVILHEFAKAQPYSIVTFMTRETTEKKMRDAVQALNKLDCIQSRTVMLRVESGF
ncbi:homoserine dehydrogenase [bacterium]|nr:homoserine dehydrogenase [bacterium]